MHHDEGPFCRCNGAGKSAIATIIVYGEDAILIAKQVFRPRNRHINLANSFDRVVYGNWITETGELGEDLVVCPISSEHFEIHCHGSIVAIEIIAQTLIQRGAIQIDAMELQTLFCGSQYFAEMTRAATQAKTGRTTSLVMQQSKRHHEFWNRLKNQLSGTEFESALENLNQFLDWQHFGLSLTQSFTIVFCGAPNAGKSSLVNAILGFDRAIVHDVAGTTRDAVTEMTALDGWPVLITDTAGIRQAQDPLEQQGIAITRESMANADLTVLIVDLVDVDTRSISEQVKKYRPDLVIGNKLDLLKGNLQRPIDLSVSAIERSNLDELMQMIVSRLIPRIPNAKQAFPVTQLQVQAARDVRDAIVKSDIAGAIGFVDHIIGIKK